MKELSNQLHGKCIAITRTSETDDTDMADVGCWDVADRQKLWWRDCGGKTVIRMPDGCGRYLKWSRQLQT